MAELRDLAGEYRLGQRARSKILEAAAALEAAQPPEGCVVVPREPTPEMIQAWHDRHIEGADYIDQHSIEYALYVECYHAMLSAAPSAAQAKGEGHD